MAFQPPPAYLRGRRSSLGNIYAGSRPTTPRLGVETGVLSRPHLTVAGSLSRRPSLQPELKNIQEASNEEPSPPTVTPVLPQVNYARGRRKTMGDIYAGGTTLTTPNVRRDSYFTRRTSAFPEKTDGCPASLRLFTFYKELKNICTLKPAVECQYNTCFANAEASGMDDGSFGAGPDLLQQAQTGALEEVQFQLYLKEIRRINPTLKEGHLFVDGLYELVCSKLPQCQESPLKKSVTDLLTVHSSKTLLLQKYWRRPDDKAEHSAYLAVSSSFVQYVLSTYGSRGVSQFLQKLDCSIEDPQKGNFSFKGKDITSLEFKWVKFAEAHVHEEFRLSILGMLRLLFRKYLPKHWLALGLILLIMFLDVGATLSLAISIGKLITLGQFSILPNATNQTTGTQMDDPDGVSALYLLLQWACIAISFILVRFIAVSITTAVQAYVAVCVSKSLRRKLSTRLNHVGPKFLSDYSASSIISTFLQDINTVEKLIAHSLRTVLLGGLSLLTFVVYTAVVIWQLAIPLTVVYLAAQALVWLITSKFSEHSFAKSQATGKLADIVKEQIDGYQINRLYGLAKLWKGQFDKVLHNQFSKKARKSLFLERFTFLCQLAVPSVLSTLLTFSFILLLQYGFLSFESGLSIVIFFNYAVVHVVSAASDFPVIQTATIAMQRINAMLYNTEHTLSDDAYEQRILQRTLAASNLNATIIPNSLAVELRDVCFSYNATASHWNLFDVSLKIQAGERVAVVGKSGSGKSSLLNIVLQVYEPTHGEVVFGEDETEYCGLKVAATFQFNHIFNMSIRENIRLGNLQATDEEVEEAAKRADLHVWVSTLTRGYDTAVSSGGSSLSGGQKQRIAIARMLVAKAPILALDEVTSALDRATETKVFNKLMEVTRGKTVIAVTHRLEQAKEFDRIVLLSHGKVKEFGSHDDLMERKQAYFCMWSNTIEQSPEKAVPIIRRRGSVTEHRGSDYTPPCGIPAIASAPVLTSPTLPVVDINEITKNLSRSQPNLTKSFDDLPEDPLPRITSTPRMQPAPKTSGSFEDSRSKSDAEKTGSSGVRSAVRANSLSVKEHTQVPMEGLFQVDDPVPVVYLPVNDRSATGSVDDYSEKWWSCDSDLLSHYHI